MQEIGETSASSQSTDSDHPGVTPTLKHLTDIRVWLICGLFVLIGILSLNDTMLYTPDSPRYLIWARSLAAFEGFKDTSNPDPSLYVVHAPLYPVILAPLAWFFQNIIIASKVLTILFGAVFILLFYLWSAKRTGRSAALIGALFLALNPLVVLFSNHVLSDIPFSVFVVLFFMLAEKMSDAPDEEKWAWLFVIVLTLGVFLREIGLTLVLGAMAYMLAGQQRRRLLLTFTIPMLFYMLWYYRNEVFVAGVENPPMRNMGIFLSHAFTNDDSSLAVEFLTRLRINIVVYLNFAKGLVLFPQFLVRPFPVLTSSDPFVGSVANVLVYAQYPLIVLQYGLFAWGIVVRWKEGRAALLVLLFAAIYLVMVLLYPVNDIRFLVPLMAPMLLSMVAGGLDLYRRIANAGSSRRLLPLGVGVLCFLVAVPNLVWLYNYVANSMEYRAKINGQGQSFVVEAKTPELYVRPASLAGKWIAEHSDSSATVLARWKELTFWMNGKKMLDSDPLLSLTLFEGILRDYNVEYLVSLVADLGIREFEFQMLQTKKFTFTSVYRAGNLEVIKVRRVQLSGAVRRGSDSAAGIVPIVLTDPRQAEARALFKEGVEELESTDTSSAVNIFNTLLGMTRGSGYVGLFEGIALEFAGRLDQALALFDHFRYQPQAGPYIKHAWYHEKLIEEIQSARVEPSKFERARLYNEVSANYWDLGFRQHARYLLEECLRADSAFTPGLIFGTYYSLQLCDTIGARRFFAETVRADSMHAIVKPIRKLFVLMDSLKWSKTPPERRYFQLGIAKCYASLRLMDPAIEQALAILDEDPKNLGALTVLAQIYVSKERRMPAIRALERIVLIKPEDKAAREKLNELRSRL